MSEALYQEVVLDYYHHPRNYGTLPHPTVEATDTNLSCGDKIHMQLRIENETIQEIKFEGKGCAISQAATSLLTETLLGKTVQDAFAISKEDTLALLGVPISAMRRKCALLGYKVCKLALCTHIGKTFSSTEEDE